MDWAMHTVHHVDFSMSMVVMGMDWAMYTVHHVDFSMSMVVMGMDWAMHAVHHVDLLMLMVLLHCRRVFTTEQKNAGDKPTNGHACNNF